MRYRGNLFACRRNVEGAASGYGGGAASPRPRRHRPLPRRPLRHGQHAPGDRRPRRRRPAALERGRPLLGDAERRDLQLGRATAGAAGARPPLRDDERHRGHRPRLRGVGPRLPDAVERRLRVRRLGPAHAGALPRARPVRSPSALPLRARRRLRLRLGGEGAAAPSCGAPRARPGRPRRELHHLVEPAGALCLRRHPRAGARALPARRRRRADRGAALVGSRLHAARRRRVGRGPDRRGRRAALRRDAAPAARGRSRRRLPERRARLVRDRGARAHAPDEDAVLVRGRLRGPRCTTRASSRTGWRRSSAPT